MQPIKGWTTSGQHLQELIEKSIEAKFHCHDLTRPDSVSDLRLCQSKLADLSQICVSPCRGQLADMNRFFVLNRKSKKSTFFMKMVEDVELVSASDAGPDLGEGPGPRPPTRGLPPPATRDVSIQMTFLCSCKSCKLDPRSATSLIRRWSTTQYKSWCKCFKIK